MNRAAFIEPGSHRSPLVADVMSTRGALVPPWLRMAAARRIAALKKVRHLFVEDGRKLAGMLDSRSLDSASDNDLVSAHMQRPPDVLTPTTEAARALEVMSRAGVTGLPVVSGGFLIGLVTQHALRGVQARSTGSGR